MSNPAAVIGLTYDGEDIQTADFSIYFWIVTGINELPSVRGTDTTVPGRAGRSEGNRINDTIAIVLMGQVAAVPGETTESGIRADWRTNMKFVRDLFASNRQRADLVASLEDGSTVAISARPMNIVPSLQIDGVYASLSIELEGYDDWAPVGS